MRIINGLPKILNPKVHNQESAFLADQEIAEFSAYSLLNRKFGCSPVITQHISYSFLKPFTKTLGFFTLAQRNAQVLEFSMILWLTTYQA